MPSAPLPPPYSVPRLHFPFGALAALTARARLGGEREVALACLMAARLAMAALPANPVPVEVRAVRAQAARGWFASLALPTAIQTPIDRVIAASARDGLADLAAAMRAVASAAARYIDAASKRELDQLIKALKE